eukprot:TRINITY_DN96820_c0_g1_i1.p2 TRINITY_DN96820_c0_g1~~TRINITY_DN96820_c0_g1_i1.p2  ORF type:complete len:173 (+),score=67.11 TRINITY_DN96820_c0_g1_i1:64-519(+)
MGNSACVYGEVDWQQQKLRQVETATCLFGEIEAYDAIKVPADVAGPTKEELQLKAQQEAEEKARLEREKLVASVTEMSMKVERLEAQCKQAEENEKKLKNELLGKINQVESTAKHADEGLKGVEEVLEAAKQKAAAKKSGKKAEFAEPAED